MICTDITQTIGNTPIFSFEKFSQALGANANIFAKLEKYNPLGSTKDRVAKFMIDDGFKNGTLSQSSTIIEPTSGNTGIGLAFYGKQMGLKVILVMPESMSRERVNLMKALGAEVILTDKTFGMQGSIDKAISLQSQMKNAVILQQFSNFSNVKAHFETTGPEIFDEIKNIDIFVAGIGTGGTISGVGQFLKKNLPNVKIIGIEPASSPFLSKGEKGPHKIQGIGAGFVPEILDRSVIDEIVTITDEEAFEGVRLLRDHCSLLMGISSGANFISALKLSTQTEFKNKNIVTIFPDGGDKYFSVEDYL